MKLVGIASISKMERTSTQTEHVASIDYFSCVAGVVDATCSSIAYLISFGRGERGGWSMVCRSSLVRLKGMRVIDG